MADDTTLLRTPIQQVIIDPATLRKLWVWACAADSELSALGEIEMVSPGVLRIMPEVHLLKQKGSMASTHLDMDAVADLMDEFVRKGLQGSRLRFWWHTHPNMSAYFSFTDDSTIKRLGELPGFDLVVAAVLNTDGEMGWRILSNGVEYNFRSRIVGSRPSLEEQEQVKPFIKQHVTKEPFLGGWGRGGRTGHRSPTKATMASSSSLNDCAPEDCRYAAYGHPSCDQMGHEPKIRRASSSVFFPEEDNHGQGQASGKETWRRKGKGRR